MKRILVSGLLILALLMQSFPVQPVAANYQPEVNGHLDAAQSTVEQQQGAQPTVNTSEDTGMVTFIGASQGESINVPGADVSALSADEMSAAALDAYAPEFGVSSPESDLQLLSSDIATDTGNYYRYQQTYHSIPVMAGEIIVNVSNEGELVSMSGEASPNLNLPTEPHISADEARSAAQDLMVNRYGADASLLHLSEPQLWIFDERLLMPSTKPAELVWRLEATVDDQPLNVLILVSAVTGTISLQFNQIDTDVTGRTWTQANVNQEDVTPTEVVTAEPEVSETPIPTETPVPNETPTEAATEVPTTEELPTEFVTETPSELPTEIPTLEEGAFPTETPEPDANAQGVIWYVSASNGNDANNCLTVATPCATIQKAADMAATGDTIYITAETYTGSGESVVMILKTLELVGGWDNSFTYREGNTRLDGQNTIRGITVSLSESTDQPPSAVKISNFEVFNGKSQFGGGVFVWSNTAVTLQNLSIHNCSATYGGGVYLFKSGYVNLFNSTITHNQATSQGGGVYSLSSNNDLRFNNVTVVYNSAYLYGGVLFIQPSSTSFFRIQNSVVSDNINTDRTNNLNFNCYTTYGKFISGGYNLMQVNSGCPFTPIEGDITGQNPRFGELLENGELFIPPDSPLVDAGNPLDPEINENACLATDQSGSTRPEDGNNDQESRCDIGASEIQYFDYIAEPTLHIFSESSISTNVNDQQTFWLGVALLDQHNIPMIGRTVIFTAPSTGASVTFTTSNSNVAADSTDYYGKASVSMKPNKIGGDYQIIASVPDSNISVVFNIKNLGVWYVSNNGNDVNNCYSPQFPCKTIQSTIERLPTSTQVINVASGTYTSTTDSVVTIRRYITINGGWNSDFSSQDGLTIIDGEGVRRGIQIGDIVSNGDITATAYISNFEIKNCKAPFSSITEFNNKGGGILISRNSSLTISNSSIHDNKGETGAGIYLVTSGRLNLRNSTIGQNQASNSGGGIAGADYCDISARNVTIAKNKALVGGGINIKNCDVEFWNSLIGENIADSSPDCAASLYMADEGYNIFTNIDGCLIEKPSNTNLFGIRLYLGQLLSNGTFFMPPVAPGIDAGNPIAPGSAIGSCLTTDQLGASRPLDGNGDSINRCDIGASEVTFFDYVQTITKFEGTKGNNQTVQLGRNYSVPLVVLVEDQNGIPIKNTTVTFTSPADSAGAIFTDTGTNSISVLTDINGFASVSNVIPNNFTGEYIVTATIDGYSGVVNFSEKNIDYWYVSTQGNDANNCTTSTTPCNTLSKVLSKAVSGDVVKIAEGIYTSSTDPVVSISKPVSLRGGWNSDFSTQKGYTTLTGNGRTILSILQNAGKVNIERFKLQDGKTGVSISTSTDVLINQSVIRANQQGVYSAGNVTIANSTIMDNVGPSTQTIATSVYVDSGVFNLVNSAILRNVSNSISSGGVGQTKPYRDPKPQLTFKNSIIFANSSTGGNDNCDLLNGMAGRNLVGAECNGSAQSVKPEDILLIENTEETYFVPHLTSYMVDNGDCSGNAPYFSQDQLGNPRIADGNLDGITKCDIGPVEYYGYDSSASRILRFDDNFRHMNYFGSMSSPFRLVVVNDRGFGASGVKVTFSVPDSGPGGTFTGSGTNTITVTTNSVGIASSGGFTANDSKGLYKMTAQVEGLPDTIEFDLHNGIPVSTHYMGHSTSTSGLPGMVICSNLTNSNCANGGNPDAVHAYAYSEDTIDYYYNHYGRISLDNNSLPIIASVNFGTNYKNSFWNGAQVVFGDNMPTDDTVGHELTHGVTDYTSGLFYFYQSGAINESLSDLWGEFIDQSNGKGNDSEDVKWLLGEDFEVFRSMKNPPDYAQPDKMSSPLYQMGDLVDLTIAPYDNGGVHTNSGINNKAVYLMAQGGSFNGYSVTGIGNEKVGQIYYEAQTHLLTSGTNYDDLYYAVSQACMNLIGDKYAITANDCAQVHKALDAVEMNKPAPKNFMKTAQLCPAYSVPNDLFSDDFEIDYAHWDIAPYGYYDWRAFGYAQTGDFSLYLPDYELPQEFSATIRNGVYIPKNKTTYLYFDHAFNFEYNQDKYGKWHAYDGGALRYEIDRNGNWLDASPLFESGAGYNGTIYSYTNSGNTLAGKPGYTRDSHGYVSSRYKLNTTALMGHTVRFKWITASDQSEGAVGWVIDNIHIYSCEQPAPGTSIFTDDFSTFKSWTDNTSGSISRDTTNNWLNWSFSQDKPGYYSIPIYASNAPIQVDFRFRVKDIDGDSALWIGFAKELDRLSTTIAGNDLAGTFVGINSSDKIEFLSRNEDGTSDQIASDDSTVNYGGAYTWRRGSLNVSGTSWAFTIKDDAGNTIGHMSGELTQAQPYFNYLVLFSAGGDGTGSISGEMDNIEVLGSPDLTTDVVSGKVVDTDGSPVAGVKITDALGNTVFTDVNGRYTLTKLHTGKKIITPSRDGDSFLPGSITLPAQATTNDVDFTASNRVPALTSLETSHVVVGTDGMTLAVNGKYFVQSSVVRWNGRDMPTTYFSSSLLKAPLEAEDLASLGTGTVTVYSPEPVGGVSNSLTLTIAPAEKFLAPPKLSVPVADGNTTSKTPVLTILPVSGAVKYQYQVSAEESFFHGIADTTKITTSFMVPATAALTYSNSYYWRARAIKADGYESAWSSPRKFTVSLQSSPANGGYTTSLLPKFSWVAMTGAKSYKLQISTSHDFSTDKVFERVQTTLGYYMTTPLPGANIYYWRVGVQTAVGGEYTFMPEWKLIVSPTLPAKPILSAPLTAALTNINTPKLSWGLVPGTGNTYEVQLSKAGTFTPLVQSALIAEGTTEYTTAPLPDGIYYWRVRTLNYLGAPSAWSTVWKLTVDTVAPNPPVLSTPAMNAIFAGTPTYSWNSSTGAKYYQFAYSDTTDCAAAVFTSAELTVRTIKPPTKAANQTYYWCVRAKDAAGNMGSWSAPRKISIIPPKTIAPVLVSPVTYSTTSTPEFKWNPVPYGESYRIQISSNSLFLLPAVDEILDPGSTTFDSSALADGKYYWRVSAINLNGVQGAWSAAKSVTVDTVTPAVPTLTSPIDGATVLTRVPKFVVGVVVSAKYYQFQVDDDSSFASPRLDKSSTYPYVTLSSAQALANGTWYWRVRSIDVAGNTSDWSTTQSINVSVP